MASYVDSIPLVLTNKSSTPEKARIRYLYTAYHLQKYYELIPWSEEAEAARKNYV